MRGLFWLPPARASSARSHQVIFWPIIFAAAAVDGSIAHDAGAGHAIAVDHGFAAVAVLLDGAADSGGGRNRADCATPGGSRRIDHQRHSVRNCSGPERNASLARRGP